MIQSLTYLLTNVFLAHPHLFATSDVQLHHFFVCSKLSGFPEAYHSWKLSVKKKPTKTTTTKHQTQKTINHKKNPNKNPHPNPHLLTIFITLVNPETAPNTQQYLARGLTLTLSRLLPCSSACDLESHLLHTLSLPVSYSHHNAVMT